MNITPTYIYNAKVTEVHDGDTLTINWDMGADIIRANQKLRLFGINCPELFVTVSGKRTKNIAGFEARDALVGLLTKDLITTRTVYGVPSLIFSVSTPVVIQTILDKTEKYGRYLATIYTSSPAGQINVNEWLIANGFAIRL